MTWQILVQSLTEQQANMAAQQVLKVLSPLACPPFSAFFFYKLQGSFMFLDQLQFSSLTNSSILNKEKEIRGCFWISGSSLFSIDFFYHIVFTFSPLKRHYLFSSKNIKHSSQCFYYEVSQKSFAACHILFSEISEILAHFLASFCC